MVIPVVAALAVASLIVLKASVEDAVVVSVMVAAEDAASVVALLTGESVVATY